MSFCLSIHSILPSLWSSVDIHFVSWTFLKLIDQRDASYLWSTMTMSSSLLTNIYPFSFLNIKGNHIHFQKNCQLQKNVQKKITVNSAIQKLPFVIDILLVFLHRRIYKHKQIHTYIYVHTYVHTCVYIYI